MNDVPKNLRAFLLTDVAIARIVGDRISQDHVPEHNDQPYIWFSRRGTVPDSELTPGEGSAPFAEDFDVECVGTSLEQAQTLAALVRAHTDHYGAFGDATCRAFFAEDQNDDYVSKFDYSDTGYCYSALDVRVIP